MVEKFLEKCYGKFESLKRVFYFCLNYHFEEIGNF